MEISRLEGLFKFYEVFKFQGDEGLILRLLIVKFRRLRIDSMVIESLKIRKLEVTLRSLSV